MTSATFTSKRFTSNNWLLLIHGLTTNLPMILYSHELYNESESMEQSKRQLEKDRSSSRHGSVVCFYKITKPHHFISTWNHDFFGFTRYLKVWLLYFRFRLWRNSTDIRHDTSDSHNEQYISLVKTMTGWLTQIIVKRRNTKVTFSALPQMVVLVVIHL